jgi:hypothetical protein
VKNNYKIKAFLLLVALFSSFTLFAEGDFAEKRIVLQISDTSRQQLVLNVANNLIKNYGPDNVSIEIVAFSSGLKLLFENNEVSSPRIISLASNGVKFSACGNTLAKMTKKMGKAPKLHKDSGVVPGGVVRILDLIDQGYILIKP